MFDKKEFSEEELQEAIEMFDILSQLTYEEFREENRLNKYSKYFYLLWIMKQRWNWLFIDIYQKIKHILIWEKQYKNKTNEIIKEREIEKKKNVFCEENGIKPNKADYYIIRKINTTDDNVMILWIPFNKRENNENKRKFGWGFVLSKKSCPELYIKYEQNCKVFNEDDF